MIKFAQAGTNDTWNVFLGITVENLQRIGEKLEPIVFPADQVGLGAGQMAVGTGGMGAALRAQLGDGVRCLELTQADADALVAGAPVERSLQSLGFARAGIAMVFMGRTEEDIVASLRKAGLITAATKVTTLAARADATTAPSPPARQPTIKPSLVLSGLVFIGVGVIGVMAAKNPALGVVIAIAGAATVGWGLRYTPPG